MQTQDEQAKTQSIAGVLHDVFHRLVENETAFRAFLRKRLGDETIIEDMFQQCLLHAVEHQHSLKNQDSVVPWFFQILRNAVIDYYRSKASQAARHEAFEKETQVLNQQEVLSFDEVRPTVCACLEPVLNGLRPSYAELLRRIDLAGESPAAVAKNLQVSLNNLTVRLHRARQALRNSLEQSCGICTRHGCLNCTCSS